MYVDIYLYLYDSLQNTPLNVQDISHVHHPSSLYTAGQHSVTCSLIHCILTQRERDAKSVFVSFYSSLMTIRVEVNGRITRELFVLAGIGVHA